MCSGFERIGGSLTGEQFRQKYEKVNHGLYSVLHLKWEYGVLWYSEGCNLYLMSTWCQVNENERSTSSNFVKISALMFSSFEKIGWSPTGEQFRQKYENVVKYGLYSVLWLKWTCGVLCYFQGFNLHLMSTSYQVNENDRRYPLKFFKKYLNLCFRAFREVVEVQRAKNFIRSTKKLEIMVYIAFYS